MTAQGVVTGKGFVSFAESGTSGSSRIERSGSAKSFDKYMSGKNGVDSNTKSDAAPGNRGGINKFVATDKVPAQKDSFTPDELNAMNEDVNVIQVAFMDGKLTVSIVTEADGEELNPYAVDIDELLRQIKEYLGGRMDISEKEIERAFYECGLNAFSLLQMNNLQQFFVKLNGMEDFSEVLTDSTLSDAWNSLVNDMSKLRLMLGEGVTADASVIGKLSENGNVFEAVRKYLAQMSNTGDSQISENVNVTEEALQGSMIDGNVQMNAADSGFGDSELGAGVESDNRGQSAAFNESLFETFINNIQESVADSDKFDQSQIRQIRDIAFQIVEGVKANVKADTSSLEIQLNPEALGKVHVALELKDGIATANFIVRNEMARIAVESQLQTLKDTFEEQGLKVEAVSVTVSDFSFEQRRQTFSEKEEERGGRTGKRRSVVNTLDSVEEDAAQVEETKEAQPGQMEHGINITA
ncbi:MAG: flagellar hook-length control protein FliK [Lachnospiraceae bacterium]|nr:flagellar hook-length control protein FliK [Lachnospiraceae bacterium]